MQVGKKVPPFSVTTHPLCEIPYLGFSRILPPRLLLQCVKMRGGGSKKVTVTPAWRKDRKGLTSDPAILTDQLRKMETKLLRSKGKLLELIDRKFGVN